MPEFFNLYIVNIINIEKTMQITIIENVLKDILMLSQYCEIFINLEMNYVH